MWVGKRTHRSSKSKRSRRQNSIANAKNMDDLPYVVIYRVHDDTTESTLAVILASGLRLKSQCYRVDDVRDIPSLSRRNSSTRSAVTSRVQPRSVQPTLRSSHRPKSKSTASSRASPTALDGSAGVSAHTWLRTLVVPRTRRRECWIPIATFMLLGRDRVLTLVLE
jgi:hypothetical protein